MSRAGKSVFGIPITSDEDVDVTNGRDMGSFYEELTTSFNEDSEFIHETPLTKFMSITLTNESTARRFLSLYHNDVSKAITMYFQTSTPSEYEDIWKRPPQARVREVLVQEPTEGTHQNYNPFKRKDPDSVFNAESHCPNNHCKKMKRLHDLYKSPFDIAFRGSFDQAKQLARDRNNWLLVNIQDMTDFNSHILNRDIWSSGVVRTHLANHFTLWQINKDGSQANWYSRFYQVTSLPYTAILDSVTGKLLIEIKTTKHDTFTSIVEDFLSNYEPPARKISSSSAEDVDLCAAIKASLLDHESDDPQPDLPANSNLLKELTTVPWIQSDYTPALLPGDSITRIFIRCPDGTRRSAVFSQSDTLKSLFEYLERHGVSKSRFEIISTYPRFVINNLDPLTSFKDSNLVPSATLFIQIP